MTPTPDKHLEALRRWTQQTICDRYRQQRIQSQRLVRKADAYYRGFQYLAFTELLDGSGWDYVPISSPQMAGRALGLRDGDPLPDVLDYGLNVIKGDIDKFTSVSLKQTIQHKSAPVIDAQIDELGGVLRVADSVKEYLYSSWRWEPVRKQIFSSLAKYGATYIYTPVVTDPNKFGKRSVSTLNPQPVDNVSQYHCMCGASNDGMEPSGDEAGDYCPECGEQLDPVDYVPAQEGTQFEEQSAEYGNTGCEIHVVNDLTVMVDPETLVINGVRSSPFLWYEYNISEGAAQNFVESAQIKLSSTPRSDGFDLQSLILARMQSNTAWLTSASGTMPTRKLRRFWLAPDKYAELSKKGPEGEIREALMKNFPRGVKLTLIDDQVVDIEHEHHGDVWEGLVPTNVEYFSAAQPLFEPYFQGQDIINDLLNMGDEIIARSMPLTAVNTAKVDPRAVEMNLGKGGGRVLPMKDDVRGALQEFAMSQPNGTIIQFMEFVLAKIREIVGINPNMWGMGNSSTAREAVINNEASLQVFAPLFNAVAESLANALRNAALQLALFSGGVLPMKDGLTEPIQLPEISKLLKGGWKFTYDPTIAISAWARRDRIMELLNSPQTAQMMGFNHPSNIKRIHEAIGMEGVYTPGMEDLDWIEEELQKLLTGGVPEPPPPMLIDPSIAVEFVRTWLKGPKGRSLRQQNPEAYQLGLQYLQQLQPPPPPMQGGPGGPGGPPPPPAGPAPQSESPMPPQPGLDGMGG